MELTHWSLFIGLCFWLVAQPWSAHAGARTLEAPLAERLRPFADRGSFSGVVCIFDDTPEVSEVAVGLADARQGSRNAPDSLFRIGSLSKTVTALLLLRMAERDGLDLDASSEWVLSEVLGRAPSSSERLPTLRELMHHTSGLRDPSPLWLPYLVGEDRRVSTARELLPLGFPAARAWAPGERFAYANVNYALLGEAIRLHTGGTLEAALRVHLAEPLGLRNVGVEPGSEQRARLSQGHLPSFGSLVTREEALGRAPDAYRDAAASGNLFASCRDFAALLRAAVWGPLFQREETRRRWLEPAHGNYAGGVVVDAESGRVRLRHAGAVAGYTSFFEVYPDARLGFVVLANLDVSAVEEAALARSLRALILEDGSAPAPASPPGREDSAGGQSRLLITLRFWLHAALAPTVPGRVAQVLLFAALTAVLFRRRAHSRLDALSDVLGVAGGGLIVCVLAEMAPWLALTLLAVLGGGAVTLLSRAKRLPWLPPSMARLGHSALSLLLSATFFGLGVGYSPLGVALLF
jgi:D-alanyl-D-alanine carboxypeptidase